MVRNRSGRHLRRGPQSPVVLIPGAVHEFATINLLTPRAFLQNFEANSIGRRAKIPAT